MALLYSATTLLISVANMSVQCFGTFVQYCTVPSSTYCAAFLSFIVLVYAGKHLYDKYLNNEIYENKVISSNVKPYLSFVL